MAAPIISPDGSRYLAAAVQPVPRPFHYRWLLPRLLGEDVRRWKIATSVSLLALLPLTWWFVGGWAGLAAAAMVPGLCGVWRIHRILPVMVDPVAMVAALAAAAAWQQGWWPLALVLVLVAGCVKEQAPVFGALWAWHPLLLVGLMPVLIRACMRAGPDLFPEDSEEHRALTQPWTTSWRVHRKEKPIRWIAPWGAAIVGLAAFDLQLGVVLAVAYGQCALATDTVRLYQWAWPVVLAAAATSVPESWLAVLVAAHYVLMVPDPGA